MKTTDEIKEDVMALFDREVRNLPNSVYRDILEEMICDLEAKLDCIREELGEDE